MNRTNTRAALLLAILASASCGGEAPDPAPPANGDQGAWVEVSLQVNGQVTGLPATVGGIFVEAASFSLRDMRLVADHGREDDRLRITARAFDLQSGRTVFRLPDAPPGLYSRLRVRLESPDEDGDDKGSSQVPTLRIAGRGPDGVPFVLQMKDDLELDLRAGDGVELAPRKGLTANAHLDLAAWFDGVRLPQPGTGSKDDDGEEKSERLRQNIRRSATLTMRAGPPGVAAPAQ